MKKIYLIRHAQSEANAAKTVRPNHLINITELGVDQANELAQWLITNIPEPVTDIFISAYVRTLQTAQPYLELTDRMPKVLEDLHEMDYLPFDSIKALSFADIRSMAEEFWKKHPAHRESELTDSFESFVERIQKVKKYFDELADGTYVVFTHGMWIRMLMWQILHNHSPRVMNMQRFREFELTIRPKNCEVFLYQNQGIQKVRTRHDGQDNESR